MVVASNSSVLRPGGGGTKKLLLCIGSSHPHRRPHLGGDASRMVNVDKSNVLNFAKLKLPADPPATKSNANGSWQKPDRNGRVKLTNTACCHWGDGKCPLGDVCIFRHAEQCLPVQMYSDTEQMQIVQYRRANTALPTPKDAYELPPLGEEMDVRIYVKNLPPTLEKSVLGNIAKAYGHVDLVDFMKSSLGNSRVAGFIHMRSKARADIVVERLNNISIDGEFVSAKIQTCIKFKTPPKPLPSAPAKPKPKTTVTTDSAGFVTKTRGKPAPPAGKAPAGKAPAGKAPAGKAPAGKAPAGKTPAGKAPAGKAPAGKAPAGKSMAELFAQLDSSDTDDDDENEAPSDLLAEREELRCVIQKGMDSGADAEAMQNLERLHELDTKLRAFDDMPALEETTEVSVAAEAAAVEEINGAGPSGVKEFDAESPKTVIGFWADSDRSTRMRNDMAARRLDDQILAEKKEESRKTALYEKEQRLVAKQNLGLEQAAPTTFDDPSADSDDPGSERESESAVESELESEPEDEIEDSEYEYDYDEFEDSDIEQ